MLKVRNGVVAAAVAALTLGGAGACSVAGTGDQAVQTVAPSVNPTTAAQPTKVDQTKLPADWPKEASMPEGLTIVRVNETASGTSVMGNIDEGDPLKVGDQLRSAWEQNGILISTSTDEGGTFSMAGLSKDGKTQLTAAISKGSDGVLQVALTEAPAA